MRYGLSKCYYCTKDGTPKPLAGAVELILNPNVRTNASETLNLPSEIKDAENIGYTGKLQLACLPVDFCVDIFGYKLTEDGILDEMYSFAELTEFQLLWQTEGETARNVMYRCVATKPNITDKTNAKNVTVSTASVNIYAYRDGNSRIRGITTSATSAEVYNSWFERRR